MNMYLCYERKRDLWVATCGVSVTVREKDKHRRPYRKKERETYAEKTNCICIRYIVRVYI